jgi:hypothetical protein
MKVPSAAAVATLAHRPAGPTLDCPGGVRPSQGATSNLEDAEVQAILRRERATGPDSMARQFYVRDNQGMVIGPYSSDGLRRLAREGKLLPTWQVSWDRQKWTVAAKVQHLFSDLDNALSAHLNAKGQGETRAPTRRERVALFIDQFILNNERFKDSLPWLQKLREWWAKLTLPRNYITAEVTPAGTKYVRHDLDKGTETEIEQKEADRKVDEGVRQFDWFKAVAVLLFVLWMVWSFRDFTFDFSPAFATLKTVFMGAVTFAAFVFKTKQTRVFVGYVLDPAVEERLETFKQAFLTLRRCSRVWVYQVRHIQGERHWKYNAGSLFTVARLPAALFNRPIPNVETNISVSGIAFGNKAVYFLPDKLLVVEGGRVRHVEYRDMAVAADHIEYVERDGYVFNDSEVVAHRWKFINRDGSQDRRFKNNAELPVVRCGIVRLEAGDARIELMTTDPRAPEQFKQQLEATL